jgi:hypothetical protein
MSYPKDETEKAHPNFNIEGFTPTMDVRMPEGWAHEFMKTESLMRHLNPKTREEHPKNVEHFRQYMTEHGVNPPECNIKDVAGSWDLKTKRTPLVLFLAEQGHRHDRLFLRLGSRCDQHGVDARRFAEAKRGREV